MSDCNITSKAKCKIILMPLFLHNFKNVNFSLLRQTLLLLYAKMRFFFQFQPVIYVIHGGFAKSTDMCNLCIVQFYTYVKSFLIYHCFKVLSTTDWPNLKQKVVQFRIFFSKQSKKFSANLIKVVMAETNTSCYK